MRWRARRDSNPRPFGGQYGTGILVGGKRSKMLLSVIMKGFGLISPSAVYSY
ncbi:hypothetical protein AvCA_49870 [Azotobacter vinelandii CA]|uniref:Uncharacterized protein n=2 Tax=Azotobacter vinelandii TaxID=354 RepID=C1DL85_AZOVD|nr:hypothetical protein Avin_49870 [Azotobacter vinelandii DJ]AGK15799.1 hypothetical protein AvCA_49870 [Azotobacter vinelandii CA]AGK22350.1 hypothetical protein AvCA6_49870 [Azotobacter vinelandii CA6]